MRVHISQAYRKIEMTKDRINLILELSAMFLSFHMVLSFVNAPIVWAILDSISCFDPSSVTTEPKYLKLWTVYSFWPPILTSKLIPLMLLVISLVFSTRQILYRKANVLPQGKCFTRQMLYHQSSQASHNMGSY